jgi:gamma-glutamyltranspeptidase/glutathione hydrolase
MVATSHPLATAAGVRALEAGGTAADAAVAAAAVLCVVDPRSTGIGGDAFALYWPVGADAPVGLEGAGPSAAGLTIDALRDAGFKEMPEIGPWTVTVPGSVDAWEKLLDRFGRLDLATALTPAVEAARDGFEVTPFVAEEWVEGAPRLAGAAATETFLPGGAPPAAGSRFVNPGLADSLEAIAAGGAEAFYRGPLGERIGAAVEEAGGPLRASDLADWGGAGWVEPISAEFSGATVFELPPPGQGIVVLEALGILAGLDLADAAAAEHVSIEALKIAFADAWAYVADPLHEDVPTAALLSESYLAGRRAEVDPESVGEALPGSPTDTVYLCVVDGEGAACSFIQSLYEGFGSGVGVPGTGIVLQNRGAGFVMEPGHPNVAAPGRRPYHTIVPAMLGRGGEFAACLGVVGGFMQPQAQVQILRGMLEGGLDPQAALDAPRVRFLGGRRIGVEADFDEAVVAELARRGHEISTLPRFGAGGAQAIVREGGRLFGASDKRKDGCAVATAVPAELTEN